jgi:hypothetical protein
MLNFCAELLAGVKFLTFLHLTFTGIQIHTQVRYTEEQAAEIKTCNTLTV